MTYIVVTFVIDSNDNISTYSNVRKLKIKEYIVLELAEI